MSSAPLPTTHEPPTTPTTRGCVNAFYRYYKGRKLGPYFVRRWKVGRRVHKEYIKPENVEKVRAACAEYRETVRAARRQANKLIDNFSFLGNMMNRLDRGQTVRPDQAEYIERIAREGPFISGRPLYRPRRRFMVPNFSKLLEFLPSTKELAEIERTQGPDAVSRAFQDAHWMYFKKELRSLFTNFRPKADPPRQSSPALGWM